MVRQCIGALGQFQNSSLVEIKDDREHVLGMWDFHLIYTTREYDARRCNVGMQTNWVCFSEGAVVKRKLLSFSPFFTTCYKPCEIPKVVLNWYEVYSIKFQKG